MAKDKMKNSTKSLVMVVVTGITLVAVTLCWFAIMDRAGAEKAMKGEVKNEASSFANIYYGADSTGEIAINPDDITTFTKIEESTIVLENMFPGAEYTYMAKFSSVSIGQKIIFSLEDVYNEVPGTLLSDIEISYRVETGEKTGKVVKDGPHTGTLSVGNNNLIEYLVSAKSEYNVIFSFKIKEDTKLDKSDMTIVITNVNAVLSD